MNNDFNAIHELEKLYQYLKGAHDASDHVTSCDTFYIAFNTIDEIITNIKLHLKLPYIPYDNKKCNCAGSNGLNNCNC